MSGHPLIDGYLSRLAGRLPADAVAELADGLTDTWHDHIARGRTPEAAARAAILEFGTPDETVEAFVAAAPGRRTARLLLATGPLVGICWGASLLAGHAWTWPVPRAAAVTFAVTLPLVVAALAGAATARRSYRRTRLCGVDCVGLIGLDAGLLAVVAAYAPELAAPLLLAVPASLIRIGLAGRMLWRRDVVA